MAIISHSALIAATPGLSSGFFSSVGGRVDVRGLILVDMVTFTVLAPVKILNSPE